MSRYVIKSLKKFRTSVLNYFFTIHNAMQEHRMEEVHLVLTYLFSGSRFNETIIGQQNMFCVRILEASFCKVNSNAAVIIPFLPFSRPF